MNLLHLKYAVEVARTGSISQAAENLYMGQPNLSKAIKELEETIGLQLFKRSSKGVSPTAKGAEFLQYARNILAQIEEMEALYRPENTEKQQLSICVPRGSYIAAAFAEFVAALDSDKELELRFLETNSMRAIQSVVDGECSMGIIRFQTAHEGYFCNFLRDKHLQSELVWEFEYLALLSRRHPLAACGELRYEELAKGIELTHGDRSVPYLSLGELRQQENTPPRRRIYVYERGSQFDLLALVPGTYMWVSPLRQETLERYNLVQRRCSVANGKYRDVLVYPRGYRRTPLDNAFLRKLFAVRDELLSTPYF